MKFCFWCSVLTAGSSLQTPPEHTSFQHSISHDGIDQRAFHTNTHTHTHNRGTSSASDDHEQLSRYLIINLFLFCWCAPHATACSDAIDFRWVHMQVYFAAPSSSVAEWFTLSAVLWMCNFTFHSVCGCCLCVPLISRISICFMHCTQRTGSLARLLHCV